MKTGANGFDETGSPWENDQITIYIQSDWINQTNLVHVVQKCDTCKPLGRPGEETLTFPIFPNINQVLIQKYFNS